MTSHASQARMCRYAGIWATTMLSAGAVQAADLPKAPRLPSDKPALVRACPEYGPGFFQAPGTDICLRVAFDVAAELKFDLAKKDLNIQTARIIDNPMAFYEKTLISRTLDRTQFRVDPTVSFWSATPLGEGTIITNATFRGPNVQTASSIRDANTGAVNTSSNVTLYNAWIKYAGFTAGLHSSFFDFSPGYTYTGGYASNQNVNLFAYTYDMGKLANFSVSIEDQAYRRQTDGGIWAAYAGQSLPDIVGRVRITPSWATIHASFAHHEIRDGLGSQTKSGFAASVGAEYRQKWEDIFGKVAEGTYGRFLLSGAWARGALSYLGIPKFSTDYSTDIGGRLDVNTGTSLIASYEHVWSHNFKTTLSYSVYQTTMHVTSFDWKVHGSVAQIGAEYQPVPALMVGAEVDWFRDTARGIYFGIPGNRDKVQFLSGFLYVKRRV